MKGTKTYVTDISLILRLNIIIVNEEMMASDHQPRKTGMIANKHIQLQSATIGGHRSAIAR